MDKKAVIIGGVIVLGLGAYFYFKPKKTGTDSSMSGLPPANTNSQISVPPTGEVITSPEEVEKIAQKIADAKALAIKIDNLKTERRQIALAPTTGSAFFGGIGGESTQNFIRSVRTKELDTQIADLEKLITDLGYAEVNGKITKIV
jgi:hypothetical protein